MFSNVKPGARKHEHVLESTRLFSPPTHLSTLPAVRVEGKGSGTKGDRFDWFKGSDREKLVQVLRKLLRKSLTKFEVLSWL